MTPTAPFADAVLFPIALRKGATQIERIASVNRITDALLGVDPAKGEFSQIRVWNVGQHLFVTKDCRDSLYFPTKAGYPLAGRPRYAWVDEPGGIRRGYLTPEAKKENDAQRDREATSHF